MNHEISKMLRVHSIVLIGDKNIDKIISIFAKKNTKILVNKQKLICKFFFINLNIIEN